MASIIKLPRKTSAERIAQVLLESSVVYDTTEKIFFGGDGITQGGFPLGKGAGGNAQTITLTQQHIDQKGFDLPSVVANPSGVGLTPSGGLPQRNGIDFAVNASTNFLTWDGLGLEGFLDVGEIVVVSF